MRVRLPREAELALRVLGREAEDVRRSLRQAVALDDLDPARVPRLEQRLGHRRAADDREPQAGEIRALEALLLGQEQIRRRDAHHRCDSVLCDELERARRVERRLEHHRRALPPREQRLHVPAADVELRQHLEDDVVVAQARRPVERQVRPEAVRVGEERALRLAGRPRRVDEEQRVVVARDVLDVAVGLERRVADPRDLDVRARRPRELRVVVRGEEERGLGVVELVRDLGRREAPGDRLERDAEARAREERRDVVRRGCRQRREPVAAAQATLREPGREPRRAAVELGVGQLAAEEAIATRSGVSARAVGEPAADGQLVRSRSSRNPATDATNRSGCLPEEEVARAGKRSSARVREGARRAGRRSAGRRRRPRRRAGRASARRALRAGRSASNVAPGRSLRGPRRRLLRRREPVRHDLARRAPAAPRRSPARARSRRTAAARPPARASPPRPSARASACGIGCAFCPPGVVQARTSRSTRSGYASASSCATIPPRLVADDVRSLDAGLVEHRDRVLGHLARRCTGRAARRSRRCRGCRRGSRRTARRGSGSTAPSPSARSRARGSGAAAAAPVPLPGDAARSRRGLLGERLAARGRMPRSRAGRLASPPGTKKTSRMNSVPRRNSGSERGTRSTSGRSCTRLEPDERAEALVEERVEEAADHRAVARPGAAEHDHHEQRQREVRASSPRASRRRSAAARRRRRGRRGTPRARTTISLNGTGRGRAPRRAARSRGSRARRARPTSRPRSARRRTRAPRSRARASRGSSC